MRSALLLAGVVLALGVACSGKTLPYAGGLMIAVQTDYSVPKDITAVGLYITAAYWFTASTSFANPAVTIARALTDTFAGIAPGSVLPFIIAQLFGAALAVAVSRFLFPPEARQSSA